MANDSTIIMSKHHRSKPPSPTNITAFPTEGWMLKDRPIKCVILGRIGKVIGYKDYYFENERVLCTRAFSLPQLPPQETPHLSQGQNLP
jgi:hypothetical protein